MAFWNRKTETRANSGLALPAGWLEDAFGATATNSGQKVTVQKALGIAPVWAAVSMISEQVGQLPLKVYRQTDDGIRTEARQHRAWRLLHDKPNEITPAGRFWSTVTTQLLLWGNVFILKRRDDMGLVEELWLLPPAEMVVKWDANTRSKTFTYQPSNGQGEQTFGTDDVLHIFGLSLDGLIGQSVISACKNAFGVALARDEFEGGFYNRGATLAGIIQTKKMLTPEAAKRLQQTAQILWGGSSKAHQIGVLEEDAEFKPISQPLHDLEFVASQQLSRTDIASMFKLPANYLGGSSGDSLTYATVEANQIYFALHAIAPWTNVIAEALTQDSSIMPQSVHDAEFVLEGMLRADSAARADLYTKALSPVTGWMVREEVRQRENLGPLPAGAFPKPQPPVVVPAVTPDAVQAAAANGNGGSPDGGAPNGP